MSEILPNRTKYLQQLYQDIKDELYIAIANADELENADAFNDIKEHYLDTLDFDQLADYVGNLFEDKNVLLFSPEGETSQSADDFSYYLEGLRLRVLIDVVGDLLENFKAVLDTDTYQKMKLLLKDKDVTLLALIVETAKIYAESELEALNRNKPFIPIEFSLIVNKVKKECEDILTTNNRKEIIEHAYRIEDIIGSHFEGLSDVTFEWTDEEIKRANWFIGVLANMEAHWYFLMLIREEEVMNLGLIDNSNVNQNRDLYLGKKDLIDNANSIHELGVAFTTEELKNSKK